MANQQGSGHHGICMTRFNGTGFSQWKFGVTILARAKKLEKVIDGTETKPAEVINSLQVMINAKM
jgi:hypothetical protein